MSLGLKWWKVNFKTDSAEVSLDSNETGVTVVSFFGMKQFMYKDNFLAGVEQNDG